MYNNTTENFLK